MSVRCGRPVLVLPGAQESARPFSSVLVAWDGGREAVRAVHDALPFLARAAEVEVVVAKPDVEHLDLDVLRPERLAQHLARHGVEVDSWRRVDGGRSVAEAIHRRLARRRFDLLVMGAYSHPRWYELLVGGASKSLLLESDVPMLISH